MMGAEYGSYPALLTAETCLRLSRRSVDTLTDRVHSAIKVGDKVGAAAKRGVDVVQAFFAIEADAAEVIPPGGGCSCPETRCAGLLRRCPIHDNDHPPIELDGCGV